MSQEQSPNAKETISRFGRLLVDLAKHEVEFALVGGLAIILNGYERLTLDADILIHDSPANIEKLLNRLCSWGEGWARELSVSDFTAQEGAIRVMEEFDLDIFTRMRGQALNDFKPRLNVFIRYLAPADLIFLKEGSWREKDQLDVLAMKAVLAREAQAS
jgi:hypothetical protein